MQPLTDINSNLFNITFLVNQWITVALSETLILTLYSIKNNFRGSFWWCSTWAPAIQLFRFCHSWPGAECPSVQCFRYWRKKIKEWHFDRTLKPLFITGIASGLDWSSLFGVFTSVFEFTVPLASQENHAHPKAWKKSILPEGRIDFLECLRWALFFCDA